MGVGGRRIFIKLGYVCMGQLREGELIHNYIINIVLQEGGEGRKENGQVNWGGTRKKEKGKVEGEGGRLRRKKGGFWA